jgi:hypothetical protein
LLDGPSSWYEGIYPCDFLPTFSKLPRKRSCLGDLFWKRAQARLSWTCDASARSTLMRTLSHDSLKYTAITACEMQLIFEFNWKLSRAPFNQNHLRSSPPLHHIFLAGLTSVQYGSNFNNCRGHSWHNCDWFHW